MHRARYMNTNMHMCMLDTTPTLCIPMRTYAYSPIPLHRQSPGFGLNTLCIPRPAYDEQNFTESKAAVSQSNHGKIGTSKSPLILNGFSADNDAAVRLIYIYIYIYNVYTHIHIYIYICILSGPVCLVARAGPAAKEESTGQGRERERELSLSLSLYVYIYIYIYIHSVCICLYVVVSYICIYIYIERERYRYG